MRKIVWCALVAASVSTAASAQEAARFDEASPAGQAAGQAPAGGSASAPAQAAAPPAPAKRLTLTAGADLPTAYMFRGLFQEDEDLIFQPAIDLGIALYEGSGALTAVTANVGCRVSRRSRSLQPYHHLTTLISNIAAFVGPDYRFAADATKRSCRSSVWVTLAPSQQLM